MKKVISFVLTTVMLLTLLVSAAFAAGTTVAASAEAGVHGETVTVDITISGNTGFDTYLVSLDYDSTALELVGMSAAGTLSANGIFTSNDNAAAFMATSVVTGDGVLFKAEFKILDGASVGDYTVNVVVDNVTNTVTLENLGASAAPGKVTVEATPCTHADTSVVDAKEATCTEEGYTGDTYCNDCQTTIETGTSIPVKDHAWDKGVVTTEPECEKAGVKTFTCGACGDTYTEEVEKTGHSYDKGVVTKEPTEEEEGIKTFTCGTCGDTYTEPVAKLEGDEGGETPPAGGDDEGGETPPAGGDDEGGETPPAGGDDEGGETPPAGGDDEGGETPPADDDGETDGTTQDPIGTPNTGESSRLLVCAIAAGICLIGIAILSVKKKLLSK